MPTAYALASLHTQLPADLTFLLSALLIVEVGAGVASVYFASAARDAITMANHRLQALS